MWRLPFYSSLSAAPYSFIYRTRLSPLNNDGRQRSTIGCENFADGASLI